MGFCIYLISLICFLEGINHLSIRIFIVNIILHYYFLTSLDLLSSCLSTCCYGSHSTVTSHIKVIYGAMSENELVLLAADTPVASFNIQQLLMVSLLFTNHMHVQWSLI